VPTPDTGAGVVDMPVTMAMTTVARVEEGLQADDFDRKLVTRQEQVKDEGKDGGLAGPEEPEGQTEDEIPEVSCQLEGEAEATLVEESAGLIEGADLSAIPESVSDVSGESFETWDCVDLYVWLP